MPDVLHLPVFGPLSKAPKGNKYGTEEDFKALVLWFQEQLRESVGSYVNACLSPPPYGAVWKRLYSLDQSSPPNAFHLPWIKQFHTNLRELSLTLRQWRTQEFFSAGVQQIQLGIEDRDDGDLGAVAP